MARQTKIYQVKFETEGFKAVARSFESINGQIDQTLRNYKQAQKVGVQQARDSQGRFVRSRLGLNFERDDRFIQRKNGDNEYRSKSRGRFAFENTEQSGAGRSRLEASAKIQGEIIGQHVAQAIRASFRGETQTEVDGNSIQTAIKSGFEFAVSSTFSGAFQRIGEKTIAEPVLSAMRQAFAENRKIDQGQNKTSGGVNPAKQVGRGVNFAASSVAFGAFQQVGSRFSADFVSGFIKGFDKKADQEFNFSLERRGEIFGGTVVDFAKNFGKDVDEAAADLKRSGKDFSQTVKATAKVAMQPFDTAIRSYRNNALDTVAVQRAQEKAAQQGKKDFSGKEEAVFVVGGFAGRQGKSGVGIARTISQNVDREKTAVIPVSNEFSDVASDATKNPDRWAAEVAAKVAALTSQGFNEDAVNMAAQAAAVKRDNPEIKIRLVGHSAGGFVAEEAQQILKMMGIEAESIALGTPNALGGLRTGQKKHIGVGDPFAKINQALEQVGLANPYEPLQTVQGHSFPDYNVPEVADLISQNRKPTKKRSRVQPTDQNVPPPDTTAIVDRQFQQVEELKSLIRGIFQPGQPGQTGLWKPDRPIPPGLVPDAVPASARSLMTAAQARAQQMRPSQLAANQQGQIRPTRGEELPQLIAAYQKSIVVAFERSRDEMLRSLRDTITNMAQAPVESDQEGFAETVKTSMTDQARKLLQVYQEALNAIVGVSADPSTINPANFGTELEQLKEDTAAILTKFREGILQNFQETAALMESIAQTYQGEAPAQMAGSNRQPYAEDFNEIIQGQLTEYQRNIRKLFAEVLQNSAADFTDLRRLRAQLGLPAQVQRGGLSTRYNDRVQQLMSGARASAQQQIRGMIPGFQELDPKQRAAELKKMRSNLTQGLTEFRSTMGKGDQDAARKLGEGLLQRIEAIRVAYEDLGKNFTGDKRGLGAQKGQLTKQSKEIQTALENIAKNATGSLAAAIEADLGSVADAGQAIGDSLIEGTEDSLDISSPSKVFQRIGEQVGQGFEIGAVKALKEARAAIQKEIQYLVALQQGDMKKAFAMVGKQAQTKGYNVGPVYHGTNANFNKFDPYKSGRKSGTGSPLGSHFFSSSKDVAESYTVERVSPFTGMEQPYENARVIKAFLDIKKALKVDAKRSNWNDIEYKGEIVDTNFLARLAKKKKKDSLSVSNVYDRGIGWLNDKQSLAKTYAVFNPNQIKSADTVTKTDRGKVVPLGARFDDSTDDIRGNVDNLSSFISEELDQFFADFAKQIRADLSQAGSDSIEGLTQGLKGGLADLETIASALGITLIEGTEDTLEISSPSRVFQRIGEQVGQGFEIGAVKALKEARAAIQKEIEYLVALQQGDMGKAAAMVGNQAKNKGYNVGPVYHGTKNAFTAFDPKRAGQRDPGWYGQGFYFTKKQADAEYYAKAHHNDQSHIMNVRLRQSNPLNVDNENDLANRIQAAGGDPNLQGKKLADQIKKLGHDGVYAQGGKEIVVFNPNQIKSADTVTKTDRGKVVPLGARFDDSTDDIRGNVDNLSSFISEELDQFFADFAKQIRADLSQAGSDSIEGLTQGLKGGLADLETIAAALGITLIEGTEDTLEIDSPSKVFQRIGANIAKGLGIGLRENLEEVKQDLTDTLSELDEEAGFQATRAVNKFNDMGGFPGLDAKAAEGIEMVRKRLSDLLDEFPAIGNLMAIGTQFGGQIALVVATFSAIGAVLKATGIDKFIGALATLPDTAAEAGRELESLNIAFQSVTGSSGLAADAMEYVSATAEKFGINIKGAEEAYLGLVATTKGTELEGFQTQKIFEAFAQTAALRGLDQQQQQQMFTAVQQVLGKGKLSAEEVRGQLGEIPALAFQQTLAGSLGVNLQQLDKLLSTGKLQSDALFKVAQAYESANAQMTGASDTATAALSRFDNAIVSLQRSVGAEFLAVQTKGAKVFTSALNGITEAVPAIVRTINSGLIVVLTSLALEVFSSATAVKLLRMALVALGNLLTRLAPMFLKLGLAILAVNTAMETWKQLVEPFQMDETDKAIRNMSLHYQELAGSISSAAEAQKSLENAGLWSWLTNTRERVFDAKDLGRSALFKGLSAVRSPWAANFASSAREEAAYTKLDTKRNFTNELISNAVIAESDQNQALKAAEKMLEIQQQMSRVKTIAAGLDASNAEGLAQSTATLKELRSEYEGYLKQVGDAKTGSEQAVKNAKDQIEALKKLKDNPYLGDDAGRAIDQDVDRLLAQIELLQTGQKELDAVTSRFEVTLADFTTALKRGVERLANFREKLTNQINEERTRLLETGLRVGKGEQTIRLELDRQDFRELEQWVRSLRVESQKITERLSDPILADQERNLREQADREGVGFGTGFLQRIVEENTENTEAAQQLLELQNLQNQITEGEVQLQQQALQARQSVRDLTRSVQDFLRQLEQELAEITLQLQEQVLGLQQQLRRSQLQKAIVAGSTGMFGSITSSVQGFLDAAGEIAQKYLGQERRKLEFEQKKYDLSTRLRDFSEGLGGATEALAAFKNGLTGTSSAGGTTAAATTRGGGAGTLVGITGSTGIGTGAHLDIRKREGDRRLSTAELDRFLVNGKPLGQQSDLITSEYGPRTPPVPGASDFHRGVDFGFSEGQQITTNVPIKSINIREPHETGGGGYVTDIEFMDGLKVSLLHQSPQIKNAVGRANRSLGTAQGGTVGVSGATAELLARIRSGEGDYTSINRGYAGDTPGGMPGLTNMTIAQVQALQKQGGAFAVGAYQFIPDTLEGAVSRSGIDRNRKFDKAAQDQLALELILGGTKRPHLTAYLTGKSDDLNAALSDISYEWAAVTGASGSGAYDGDSAGNRASISVADLLPQVRAQVQGASPASGIGGSSSTPVVPSEVARGQAIGSEILATQRSQMAASEGEISVAVIDLVQQRKNVLEEVRRLLETSTRDLGTGVTDMANQMQQYINPDALLNIQTQVRQQFDDFNLQLYTESKRVGDSIAELQGIIATYPPVIEQLNATGDPLDAEQANLLQGTVDMAQTYLTTLEAIDQRLTATQSQAAEAYQKEQQYLIQKNQLETANAQIALELEIAQTNRNSKLETELAIQQERNNLASQLLEKERELSNRPDELARQSELLRIQSEQRIQTLQFEEQRRALDERSFQTELQTRLTEAQAAQAEGQFGDNGVFGFRATALREENALLQEQIRYEQEVLALRERYRDPDQAGLLGQMLDQARQLNQVNLQNIDTQFKDLGETIAQVAEDALGQFFEDIFTGSKTAGEALRSLAQSVLRMFAQMAAKNLAKSIFGSLGGAFGGFFGGGGGAASTATGFWGWADGGTIPNYAQGGRVLPDAVADVMRSLVPGVDAGFRREGTKAALGIFTPGEEILSLKTGEAQRYQLLKKSLGTNPLQSIMTGNFAYGGTVGINPAIINGDMGIHAPLVPVSSVLQMQSGRGASGGGGNVTINYEVKTPDANSFRRSQYQIDKDATVAAKRVLNRK